MRWYALTGDPTPTSIGRVPPQVRGDDGDWDPDHCLAAVDLDQQLSIHYRLGPASYRTFVLARSREDFPDEAVELAARLQPLLALLARHAAVAGGAVVPTGEDLPALTLRERAVLRLLVEGLTAQSMAVRLGISPRTVHRHLAGLYRKLDVRDRLQAALVAQRLGLDADPGVADDGPRPGAGVTFRVRVPDPAPGS